METLFHFGCCANSDFKSPVAKISSSANPSESICTINFWNEDKQLHESETFPFLLYLILFVVQGRIRGDLTQLLKNLPTGYSVALSYIDAIHSRDIWLRTIWFSWHKWAAIKPVETYRGQGRHIRLCLQYYKQYYHRRRTLWSAVSIHSTSSKYFTTKK